MCVVRYAKALHAYYWLGDYTDSDLMVPGDSDGRVRHDHLLMLRTRELK